MNVLSSINITYNQTVVLSVAQTGLSTQSTGVYETPVVANPVYELQEDVLALHVARKDDNRVDTHPGIGYFTNTCFKCPK